MASPAHPGQGPGVTLSDPNCVREAYANRVASINVSEGIVHVTLSVVRPKPADAPGGGGNENVVAERFAMPISAMEALVNGYAELKRAMQMAQQQKLPPQKPN